MTATLLEHTTVSNVVLMNLGPDWRCQDGTVVARGEQFVVDGATLETMRRRYQLGTRFMIMAEHADEALPTSVPRTAQPVSHISTAAAGEDEQEADAPTQEPASAEAPARALSRRERRAEAKAAEAAKPKRAKAT